MRYTQSQVRELLELPVQTYRYWAASIPHLASRTGKAAVFTASDLLGLALVKEACTTMGLSVGSFRVGINHLFTGLDEMSWPSTDEAVLVLTNDTAEFTTLAQLASGQLHGTTLLVPCGQIMDMLRTLLSPGSRDDGERRPASAGFQAGAWVTMLPTQEGRG